VRVLRCGDAMDGGHATLEIPAVGMTEDNSGYLKTIRGQGANSLKNNDQDKFLV
jgi:hypothetical protein